MRQITGVAIEQVNKITFYLIIVMKYGGVFREPRQFSE